MDPWIPWEFMLVTANHDHIYQKCFGTKILLEELERDDKNSLVNSESGNEGEVSSVMVRKSLLLNGIASLPPALFPQAMGQGQNAMFVSMLYQFRVWICILQLSPKKKQPQRLMHTGTAGQSESRATRYNLFTTKTR